MKGWRLGTRRATGTRECFQSALAKPSCLNASEAACRLAQAASDMWAVGALAWELLTGRPLFGDAFSDEDVVMALLGFKPLPFEADPSLWVLFTESQVINCIHALHPRHTCPIAVIIHLVRPSMGHAAGQ